MLLFGSEPSHQPWVMSRTYDYTEEAVDPVVEEGSVERGEAGAVQRVTEGWAHLPRGRHYRYPPKGRCLQPLQTVKGAGSYSLVQLPPLPELFKVIAEPREQVEFSMAIENEGLMHECCPTTKKQRQMANTWRVHALSSYPKSHCSSPIAHLVSTLENYLNNLPYNSPTMHNRLLHL